MSAIESLINAAQQQGGEILELRAGRPAVMVKGAQRLKAGRPLSAEVMQAWLESVASKEALLPMELGEEARVRVDANGGPLQVVARQITGELELDIRFGVGAPAAAQTPAAAAPAPSADGGEAATADPSDDRPLDRFLRKMVDLGASDLHLSADQPPMLRLHGEMTPLGDYQPLASDHIQLMCDEIAPAKNRREFREENDTDFAYQIEDVARFRVNVFRDRNGVGAVLRQIPTEIVSMDGLGLPECVTNLCMLSKGLVLVTGPTGSGKSTTLASMIDYINDNRSDHIITIEDPIEFVHQNKKCLINQREVHSHTQSFKRALRAALREDPDIVLVGEMRDLETIAIAIETAETGHLVFGTLHTTTAVNTVDRIIDQFPADRQEQVRMMLADSLKGVIAQTLCRRREGGRVAAFEILLGIPAVSNLIREGKTHQLTSIIQTNRGLGMRMLNDSLAELVKKRIIDANEAVMRAIDKDGLRGMLKPKEEPAD